MKQGISFYLEVEKAKLTTVVKLTFQACALRRAKLGIWGSMCAYMVEYGVRLLKGAWLPKMHE